MDLDQAADLAYQLQEVGKVLSKPSSVTALIEAREVLLKAVELRDNVESLKRSAENARREYDKLTEQVLDLQMQKETLESEIERKQKELSALGEQSEKHIG